MIRRMCASTRARTLLCRSQVLMGYRLPDESQSDVPEILILHLNLNTLSKQLGVSAILQVAERSSTGFNTLISGFCRFSWLDVLNRGLYLFSHQLFHPFQEEHCYQSEDHEWDDTCPCQPVCMCICPMTRIHCPGLDCRVQAWHIQ